MVETRLPENAGELQQILHAINWMCTALLKMAEAETPLRSLLEEGLRPTSRNKRVASRNAISNMEQTEERLQTCDNMLDLVT